MSTTPETSTDVVFRPAPPTAPEAAAARASFAADVSAAMGVTWQLAEDADADLAGPDGAFWLARRAGDRDGEVLGCVGARAVALADGPAVEVKRLWVSAEARGLGLGARLLDVVERWARDRGATRLVLDTRGELEAATRLYRRTGWVEVAPYNDNADAQLWFSKPLG
ncbi:GNAT family N-acetyltransferase [Quadrisphaera sp. INWT6]|uniref:GNAT family N-acetyltransferase n=1 Tax=Quadrisphaera sp. INWT6 TaxID=2596917 RepID=UPI00189204A4|nr:GNAT family N-acetyltransferase [Quadrisphaera sp. INWT6]MBF5081541.1 GNAT family N-acetyltransferase [Quadrisphaera sp. INWT6]